MPDLEALLAEYIERLNAGEALDVDSIRREHPDVADDLISELRLFQGIVPAPSEEQPLGTLGDYTLRRQIGRGGMGVVYEAWENSMDRRVALKVLPAGIAADARASARFLREAQTAGKLDHRNIVRVYSTGVREGTPWYSMEFVEGQTLAKIAAAMRAAPSDAPTPFGQSREHLGFYSALAAAFADVADGLQHAHAEGVVHRDIKPSNLILDHQGRLRILDFGLARLEGQESLTFSGDLVGTVRYMSPEQAQARKIPIDHRTDVYSLGATMYEMLALRPPFEGKDHRETLGQIIERDPVEPRRVNPRVPKDLETIVLKCLRKDPRDRYGTAEALAQDLRRFVRGDPIEARPQSGWERLAARVRRHKKILFAAAAFLTLLLAVAWFAYQERRAHERRMADAYEPAVLRVLRELLGREFSLRVVARQAEGLFQFEQLGFVLADRPDGALLPVTPEDFAALREAQGSHAIDEAIEELLKVADIRPHRPDAHYHLAKAYELIGRLEEARTEILRALDCDPDFVPAKVLRVRLQGLDEKSLEFETIFREYCERDDWRRWWVEAYKEVKETRWPEAAEAYGKLIAFWAGGAEPYIGSAIEAHIGRGLAYLETKQFMRALGDFRAACTLAPGFVEGTLLIGTAFYLAGRAEHVDEWRNEAEEIFEKLLARASFRERKEVVLWIAALYDSFKDFSLGLEWEEKLGEGPLADRLRAYFRYARGDVKDAIEAGRSAISGNAEDLIAHLVLAAALRCALWRQRGPERERTLSELLRVSRRALELDPQRASAREHLAVAVEQGGFSPDGLEVIDTGIDGKVFGQTPSDDERTLYFSRFDGNPRGDVDIYFMTRADRSEPFSVPARPVEGLDSPFEDWVSSRCLSAGGEEIYFTSTRIPSFGFQDLFVARFNVPGDPEAGFVAIDNLGTGVNAAKKQGNPNISRDGLRLYFRSGVHFYVAKRATKASAFREPVLLSGRLGASQIFAGAISADERTLFWSDDRQGSYDIWMATRESVLDHLGQPVPFEHPEPFGPPINTRAYEAAPTPTADWPAPGSGIYFVRDLTTIMRAPWPVVGPREDGQEEEP